MRYVGDFPILYKGEKREVCIVDGICSEVKTVEPVVYCEGKDLIGGIWVYDKQGEREAVFGTSTLPNDLFASYRGIHLLLQEKVITREGVVECCLAALTNSQVQNNAQRAVIDRLGGEKFGETVTATVPKAQDALKLLYDIGIAFNGTAVTEEVRAGRLQYTKSLEDMGVRDPRVVDAEAERRNKRLAPYIPHIRAFLAWKSPAHDPGCDCERHMLATVETALRKGLTEDDLIVGYAVATEMVSRLGSPIGTLVQFSLGARKVLTHREVVTGVADFLAEHFASKEKKVKGRTAKEYQQLLFDLNKKWDDMSLSVEL